MRAADAAYMSYRTQGEAAGVSNMAAMVSGTSGGGGPRWWEPHLARCGVGPQYWG